MFIETYSLSREVFCFTPMPVYSALVALDVESFISVLGRVTLYILICSLQHVNQLLVTDSA